MVDGVAGGFVCRQDQVVLGPGAQMQRSQPAAQRDPHRAQLTGVRQPPARAVALGPGGAAAVADTSMSPPTWTDGRLHPRTDAAGDAAGSTAKTPVNNRGTHGRRAYTRLPRGIFKTSVGPRPRRSRSGKDRQTAVTQRARCTHRSEASPTAADQLWRTHPSRDGARQHQTRRHARRRKLPKEPVPWRASARPTDPYEAGCLRRPAPPNPGTAQRPAEGRQGGDLLTTRHEGGQTGHRGPGRRTCPAPQHPARRDHGRGQPCGDREPGARPPTGVDDVLDSRSRPSPRAAAVARPRRLAAPLPGRRPVAWPRRKRVGRPLAQPGGGGERRRQRGGHDREQRVEPLDPGVAATVALHGKNLGSGAPSSTSTNTCWSASGRTACRGREPGQRPRRRRRRADGRGRRTTAAGTPPVSTGAHPANSGPSRRGAAGSGRRSILHRRPSRRPGRGSSQRRSPRPCRQR